MVGSALSGHGVLSIAGGAWSSTSTRAWLGFHELHLALGLDPSDPVNAADPAQELTWLGGAPWAKVALIITVAVFVLMFGGALAKRRPRRGGGLGRRRDFSLEIARLESLPRTPIAEALDGPVHLEGVLASASETLGGEPGRERVYFNRAGAGRKSAVASELVLLRDASGQVSIENLEAARVITAKERHDPKRPHAPATISLRIGERVQVLGYFRGEVHGRDEVASERVYGVLGDGQQIQVRVLPPVTPSRPAAAPSDETDTNASESAPADHQPQAPTDHQTRTDA